MGGVTHDVAALVGPDGVARIRDLARRVDRHTIGRWVAGGRLLRPFPGVVVLPLRADEWRTRALAAVYATDGVLSHTSALTVWRLADGTGLLHVSIDAPRRALRRPGLVVHRAHDLVPDRLGPYPVTDLPRALTDAWGLASTATGRKTADLARRAVIDTLRDRRVSPAELRRELDRRPTLRGRAALLQLVALVESGCQSELEIWGVRRVLRGPDMPAFVQQHKVRLPFATVHLDAALPDLRIAVELDGAAFHGSPEHRERDTRRDVALAALGWVVLRFSYARLTGDPEGCRREILAVCSSRRRLLGR